MLNAFGKAITAGAFLFPLFCGMSAFAVSAPADFVGNYVVVFSIKGGISTGAKTSDDAKPDLKDDLIDGEVYSFDEIDRITKNVSDSSDLNQGQSALFRDATLVVSFYESNTEYSKEFPLAHCQSIDIRHGVDLIEQNVICDGRTYKLGVRGTAIEVMRNDEIELSFEIGAGQFTLNGKTFPADG